MSAYAKSPWKWEDVTEYDVEGDSIIEYVMHLQDADGFTVINHEAEWSVTEANQRLTECAPEMAEMLLDLYHGRKTNGDIDALLKKAGVLE